MDAKRAIQISKFLSLVLRHQPQKIGITLDAAGWVPVTDLLESMARQGKEVTPVELKEIVAGSDKQRFAFSEDGLRIRASQGHSVEVELGYESAVPPEFLYHGTVEKFLDSIGKQGLIKGNRHHVHLSADTQTAEKVGQRRGRPIILKVHAGTMRREGHAFFVSANGVWLTDHVPPGYLEFPTEHQ